MEILPANFTYRSTVKQINCELIKAGFWMTEDEGTFFMYHRQRGRQIGKLFSMKNKRQEMFDLATRTVNSYLRTRGWIK